MLVWTAVLLLAACAHCTESSTAPGETLAVPERLTHRGADFFGINEAVSIPRAWLDNDFVQPDQEPAILAADATSSWNLGARIVRGNSAVYPYLDQHSLSERQGDWTRSDLWVSTVQEAGLEALLVIGPWPGNRTAAYTTHYLPTDLEAYDTYVRAVVERYDGDGNEDMPGLLRGVRYWEIDNEPDLHNTAPARGAVNPPSPSTFQTPEEYARILIRSAAVIRDTHPDPVILSAGFFRPHHPQGRSYMESLLEIPGTRNAFDILSLHCYFEQNDLTTIRRTMETAAALLPDKPVWITETGVPSIGRGPHIDRDWQARMLVATYGAFLAEGADRIFWHTLSDPPNPAQHLRRAPFASHSLLAAPEGTSPPDTRSEDKPAGAIYRRLSSLMADVSPTSLDETVHSDGRILATDQGWLVYWGTAPLPEGAGRVISLMDGEAIESLEQIDAPAWIHRSR